MKKSEREIERFAALRLHHDEESFNDGWRECAEAFLKYAKEKSYLWECYDECKAEAPVVDLQELEEWVKG